MNDPAQVNTETLANPPAKPQLMIKAFGIGSAGVNLLDQLARDGVAADSLIAVHSDAKALSACLAGEKVHFENKASRAGNGREDSDLSAIMAAEEQLPRLKSLCSGADVILIIAGLGGVLGTGLSFLELCRSIGCHSIECVFGIAEGTGTNRAPDALEHLLAHPMLNDPELFQQAPAVGVGVLGGPALAMAEVNRIMDEIHRRCEA